MVNNKIRKGFTLIEVMFVIILLSIISLIIFTLYNQFYDIKQQIDAEEKLKTFKQISYQSLYDINKVKQILASSPLVYDDLNNKYITDDLNIKYFDNKNVLTNIMEPGELKNFDLKDTSVKQGLENFFNISFNNDLLFYSNMFYFYKTKTENFFGNIKASYKIFTFIHINDTKFSNYLKRLIKNKNKNLISYAFDTTGNYLVVNQSLKGDMGNKYINKNWKNIRKTISIIKYSTREQIYEPIKTIKNNIDETQSKINDWGTIQARFEAHKSISTGNTLDTDYFISCVNDEPTNNYCKDHNTIVPQDDVRSANTLLKLDNGSPNIINKATFSKLDKGKMKYTVDGGNIEPINADTDYGFLVLNNDGEYENSTTNGCQIEISEPNNLIDINIINALNLTMNNELLKNGSSIDDCITTKSMSSLVEDFNPFGYPVMLSNGNNAIIDLNGNGTYENIDLIVGNNRYPDVNNNTEAPFNATVFTVLPNKEIVYKKLYGHVF